MPTQKSSPKLFLVMTLGFVNTHSPFWLRNSRGNLSRCRFKNHHRNSFQSWRMDSSAHTSAVDSEIFKETYVTVAAKIIIETACRADAWIRQCTQPLFTQKYSRKTESPPTQKSSPKLLGELMLGFDRAHCPCSLKNIQGKLSRRRLKNHPQNCLQSWHLDSSAHTALFSHK